MHATPSDEGSAVTSFPGKVIPISISEVRDALAEPTDLNPGMSLKSLDRISQGLPRNKPFLRICIIIPL